MATAARALRIVHTSDWHLGVELGTQSRRSDHQVAITSVEEIAKDFAPDAIVHTGDLFDHSRPGAEDQAMAVDALRRLSAVAPTVVVGGNHDNNVMLDRAWDPLATLAGNGRLMFRGRPRKPEDGGVIAIPSSDGARRLLVCAVPFVTSHSFAKFDKPGETTKSFTYGMNRLYETYKGWLADNRDPATDSVIWAAHLLISGAQPAGSERRVDLADDYATTANQIPPVSYAAFGHIHRAQELPGVVTGRYAGGMLPFRFDESRDEAPPKGVVLVELPATGAPKVTPTEIATGRRLVELHERLEDLPARSHEVAGCFVRVTVSLDGPVPGLMLRVIDALPEAIVVEVRPESEMHRTSRTSPIAEPSSLDDMLGRWIAENPIAGTDPERTASTVKVMVDSATSGKRIPLDDETLLDRDIAEQLLRDIGDIVDWSDEAAEAAAADLLGSSIRSEESMVLEDESS